MNMKLRGFSIQLTPYKVGYLIGHYLANPPLKAKEKFLHEEAKKAYEMKRQSSYVTFYHVVFPQRLPSCLPASTFSSPSSKLQSRRAQYHNMQIPKAEVHVPIHTSTVALSDVLYAGICSALLSTILPKPPTICWKVGHKNLMMLLPKCSPRVNSLCVIRIIKNSKWRSWLGFTFDATRHNSDLY